ncbi:MAG: tRNA-dihydrouridine synthase [Candidatus Promineifilaceae bacterium]
MNNRPEFYVRDVPVYGDVILAPMAGFADVPHRSLCRSFGSALNYTEFVAVEDIIDDSKTAKSLLDFSSDDRPMVIQLFGNDAGLFLEAASRVEDLGPDIIDINMGCSTRRVSGRGAGVGMMPKPGLIEETFNLLSSKLGVPVTGKIRLGWEDETNYAEVAQIMEDNGASLIAIHPRTKEQGYRGVADWDAISELRQLVKVPVIGSGDVRTPDDIDRMLQHTGCDAVMIGRGALGNPWVFSRLEKNNVPLAEVTKTIRRHLLMMLEYHGDRGLILFRKYLKRYLDRYGGIEDYRRRMLVTESTEEFLELLENVESAIGGNS